MPRQTRRIFVQKQTLSPPVILGIDSQLVSCSEKGLHEKIIITVKDRLVNGQAPTKRVAESAKLFFEFKLKLDRYGHDLGTMLKDRSIKTWRGRL